MIENFNEHAANERTFLAWVRTAVAVAGFGFVIERLPNGSAPVSNAGEVLLGLSALLVLLSSVRFLVIRRQIDTPEAEGAGFSNLEVLFVGMLAVLLGAVGVFLVNLS